MAHSEDDEAAHRALGRRIRQLREQKRLTAGEFAADAKIAPSYLSGVERGSRQPSLDVLNRISRALDVQVVALLQGVWPYGSDEQPKFDEPVARARPPAPLVGNDGADGELAPIPQ